MGDLLKQSGERPRADAQQVGQELQDEVLPDGQVPILHRHGHRQPGHQPFDAPSRLVPQEPARDLQVPRLAMCAISKMAGSASFPPLASATVTSSSCSSGAIAPSLAAIHASTARMHNSCFRAEARNNSWNVNGPAGPAGVGGPWGRVDCDNSFICLV